MHPTRASRCRYQLLPVLALLAGGLSCSSSSEVTSVRLAVVYEPSWSLDRFELSIDDHRVESDASPTLLVLLPDELADAAMQIELAAQRGAEPWAHGRVEVTPVRGREIPATLVLQRLPCGAWCTEGATTCMGDGVAICEQRDDDSCMEWSEPIACANEVPYCSLGVCAAECVDECAAGESRCDGPGAERQCGQATDDSDPCRDWLPATACAADDTCSNGHCGAICQDECATGEVDCFAGGLVSCDDLDGDGCRTWGPPTPCPGDTTCSGGACTDECTDSGCDGSSYRECAQFDLDDCLDLSPGSSCVPADACQVGMCTAGGCESEPVVCDEQPAPMCLDDTTLRSFASTGTCSAGACSYAHDDTTCDGGGSCSGGACTAPPGCTPIGWAHTTIDANARAARASLAVDATGRIHVAYQGASGGASVLRYATAAGPSSAWSAATVPGGGTSYEGLYADLALDATGNPSIVHINGSHQVYLATKSRSGWVASFVASSGDANPNPALAIDAAGTFHVPYQHEVGPGGAGQSVRYSNRAAGATTWSSPTTLFGDCFMPTVVAAPDNRLHLVAEYAPLIAGANRLVYFQRSPAGVWDDGIQIDTDVYTRSDLVLDADGGTHIAYRWATTSGSYPYDVDYAYLPPGAAEISYEAIATDVGEDVGDWGIAEVSIALDPSGGVHVVYYGGATDQLIYAVRATNGSWTSTPIVAGGHEPSLAIDALGGLHLSYRVVAGAANQVKYAYACDP